MRSIAETGPIIALFISFVACGGGVAGGKNQGGSSGGAAGSATGGSAGKAAAGSSAGGAAGSGGQAIGGAAGSSTAGSAGKAAGGSSSGGAPTSVDCANPPASGTAPAATWVNATGNLANMTSECGNLGLVSAQPCSNRVIAGVAKMGLWATEDGGTTWTKLGAGGGSAMITNRISNIVYDPADPNIFWEAGIYNGGGVYKTSDSGNTFAQLGSVTHNDSVSVDLSDPDRKTLIAGPHEQSGHLFRSTDSGATWPDVGSGLPGGGFCTATHIVDATTFLVGCTSGGIQRSTDSGSTWNQASGSGGVVPQPLIASDGTIYWPGSGGGMYRSTDQGQSFTQVANSSVAPGIVAPAMNAELPDGRIVIIGTDHLLISDNQGATWQPIGDAMPYPGGGYDGARGVTYSVPSKTFFIWRWDCGTTVPSNAIMSAGFDWETQ